MVLLFCEVIKSRITNRDDHRLMFCKSPKQDYVKKAKLFNCFS